MGRLVAIFCLGWASLFAQEGKPPNYKSIEKNINDEESPFYYKSLLSRLEADDTTLTIDHYRHLYYGQVFQTTYNPYGRSGEEDALRVYYQKDSLSQADLVQVIELCKKSLDANPFELNQLNFLRYAYKLQGEMNKAAKMRYRFDHTIDAILSTGDGKTCKTGWHVISTTHEYVILNLFQFQFTSQALTKNLCDRMSVKKDDRGIEEFFFDVHQLFEHSPFKK